MSRARATMTYIIKTFSNKKFLLFLILVAVIFSATPSVASAVCIPPWCNPVGDVGQRIAAVLDIIKNLPVILMVGYFAGSLILLSVVIGGIFTFLSMIMIEFVQGTMSILVTPESPIVEIGFTISKNIANMVLILILAFMGLATILRFRSYEMQKILPTFLLVALLVNFSGVLVGFIVDISNIITIFFLSKTAPMGALGELLGDIGGDFVRLLTAEGASIFPEAVGFIADAIVRILYYTIGLLVVFIIMLLFFVRIIILWVLSMLAPLAFVSYILPATRKFWNQWWSNLIQWSIIGIPISFFLYISSQVLSNIEKVEEQFIVSGGLTNFGGIWATLFDHLNVIIFSFIGKFVVLILMAVGVALSLTLAPASAGGVINFGKKTGVALGMIGGTAAWRKIKGIERIGGKFREMSQGLATRQEERLRTENLGFRGKVAAVGKITIGRAGSLLGSASELQFQEVTRRMKMGDEKEFKDAQKEAANKDHRDVVTLYREAKMRGNKNKMVGYLNQIVNNTDGQDLADRVDDGTINPKDIKDMIVTGRDRLGPPGYRPIAKTFYGDMMSDPKRFGFSDEKDDEGKFKDKLLEQLRTEITKKYSNQDILNDVPSKKSLDPETPAGKYFFKEVIEQRDADLMQGLARRPDKQERDKIMKYIFEDMYGDKDVTIDKLAIVAPGALRYISSTGARSVGVGIEGLTAEKVEEIIEKALKKAQRKRPKEGPGGIGPEPRQPTGPEGSTPSRPPSDRRPTGPGSSREGAPTSQTRRPTGPGQ